MAAGIQWYLMRLRELLILLALSVAICHGADPATISLRGKLTQRDGKPALELSSHKLIPLDGDEATRGILKDKRLAGADLEATGHYESPDKFVIDPIHTTALHVYHDGVRHKISYWCDVCSIRTYTPGICWCCQQETALDLQKEDKE
jgi:hypothetical protein